MYQDPLWFRLFLFIFGIVAPVAVIAWMIVSHLH
jgi:hypothetical protein